ncbi:MAG: diguanylate cyclase response regulator [Rhizobiales bacterium PAR1]|nr:MAG: diguanylate cyclase response regulator [Rhizobiales bacterium PAR1]
MRILLAEPSRIGRTIVANMLSADGHEIVCSGDADEALAFMRSGQEFDVLITAIEFATISGFELCWEAKLCTDNARPVYVIVLSSSRDELKLVEALDSGADDYITKPPRASELLARLRAAGRLLAAQNDLIRLASYDSLTNLRNRRSFFEELEKNSFASAPVSILMLDVDHFKQINDRYGHDIGDEVLRVIARRASAIDKQFSRLGGEEFGLLVHAPLHIAGEVAERIRFAIADEPFETAAGPLTVTASIGVAERLPGSNFEDAMREADVALYASKSGGRNRVTLSRNTSDSGILHFNVAKVA